MGIRERSGIGLKVKLAVMIGAFLIVNTVILCGILIYKITDSLEDELKEKGVLITKKAAKDSLYGVLIGDLPILDGIMKDIKNDPDIVYGIILNNHRKVLAHTNIEERGKIFNDAEDKKVLSKKEESGVSFEEVSIGGEVYTGRGGRAWRGERAFNFSTPIYSNDSKVGSVVIRLSLKGVTGKTMKIFWAGASSTAVIIVFIVIFSYFFVGFILSPIEEITRVIEGIAEEDIKRGVFTRRLNISSGDEIGRLSSSFNNMLDSLEDKDIGLRQNMRELRARMDELKSTRDQLIHSARLAALGELAGHIAHEINNPLTSVLGYTSLLIETESDPERTTQLKIVEGEGLRAREIVKKLLDFAHQVELKRERVDINHIIKVVLSLVTGPARASNIAIKEEYTEGLPDIMVDVSQIEQVFLNIINNSMDAMPNGGILTVKSFLAGGYITVSVSDKGRGIEAEMLPRIFEPFFTTKDKVSGAGLGLSVSLGIIERHGGKIDVESSVGEGTKFTVRLPVAVKKAEAKAEVE
ncbi:MAG: ATP-binding protein [Nitrospirota bacterium]